MKTNSIKKQELQTAVKNWQDLGISYAEMTFDCGGDSMGDYYFSFYKKENEKSVEVISKDLDSYFSEAVYEHVEFYVNSDGHYIGESGTVHISLDDDDLEEPRFSYSKESKTMFSESKQLRVTLDLSEKELELFKNKVSVVMGDRDAIDTTVNYTQDTVINDEEELLLESIIAKIKDVTNDISFDDLEDDDFYLNDEAWYSFEAEYSTDNNQVVIVYDVNGTSYGESY